jgi:hypothetical protein
MHLGLVLQRKNASCRQNNVASQRLNGFYEFKSNIMIIVLGRQQLRPLFHSEGKEDLWALYLRLV